MSVGTRRGGEGTSAAGFSLRVVWSLARWVDDTYGPAALGELAREAGVEAEDFDGTTCWISGGQLETILAAGRRLAGDEPTFRRALVHRFEESYGAFKHMIWSLSMRTMCRLSVAMSNKVITRIGHFEEVSSTRTTFRFRYTAPAGVDTELMCLSRRVAWSESTRLQGLPPAEVTDVKCMSRGDDCCEYDVKWLDTRIFRQVSTGLALGLVVGIAFHSFAPLYLIPLVLALSGAALGYVVELRRIATVSTEKAEAAVTELRALGEAEAETRSELAAMQQRQHLWTARMEAEAADRDAALDHIVKSLEGLQRSRETSIRGFSHDLRNPLFIVQANTRLLRERLVDGEEAEMLDDIESGAAQMGQLLARLMDVATADSQVARGAAQSIDVAPMAEVFRRRLRALVHGRGLDVEVDVASGAPPSLVVDRLVFDRVVDNLLTNAAKYTERGRISLTLRGDGDDGLVFELSDTGRGIEPARIAEIFRPRAPGAPSEPNSYGVGLSSAVRLLAQIGGGLEVTSRVGKGSTFRARFPLRPRSRNPEGARDANIDDVIARVVTVTSARPEATSRH